jgi:uncharacterized membrane protein YdcZ (DUF606 family)
MPVDSLILIPCLAGILSTIQASVSAKLGSINGDGFSSVWTGLSSSVMAGVVWGVMEGVSFQKQQGEEGVGSSSGDGDGGDGIGGVDWEKGWRGE